MIRYYKSDSVEKNIYEISDILKGSLIYLENPSQEEILELSNKTNIPKWFFDSALDEEEQSRIEYENETTLVLIDIPKELDVNGNKSIVTIPLAIIMNAEYFITVCIMQTSILDNIFKSRFKVDTTDYRRLFYHLLYNNFTRFLYYLKKIDKISNELQKNVSKAIQNKEILEILELQKALVFFSTSLSGNYAVVQKLINSSINKSTPEEKDILDDILIEAKQAIEMCTVYREILKNSMDAFSSITNNNMNIIMKFLTAVTIILSIPMIIAGFWGMNTGVPWEGLNFGFWLAIGISIIFSIITLIYFIKNKMM